MRSTTLVGLAFAALASAQSTPATAAIPQASLDAASQCASRCDPSDVNCLAACVGVPAPNASQANGTTECAANCPQGDGSPADTERYGNCVQSCISSIFIPVGTAAPTPGVSTGPATASATPSATGAAGAASSGASRASSAAGTGSGNGTGAPTGTGASSEGANNASRTGAAPTSTNSGSAASGFGPNAAGLVLAFAAIAAM